MPKYGVAQEVTLQICEKKKQRLPAVEEKWGRN